MRVRLTLAAALQDVLHLLHRHLQNLCVLHLRVKLQNKPRAPSEAALLLRPHRAPDVRARSSALTSASASRVRSSCRLSLMRARLFFSTRGFLICGRTEPKIHLLLLRSLTDAGIPRSAYLPVCSLDPAGLVILRAHVAAAGPNRRGHAGAFTHGVVCSPSGARGLEP